MLIYLVLLSRAVYALMWFYIAPVLPMMLREFNVDPALAGVLPAVFIVGAATAQLPASFIGAKFGHNKIAGIGLIIFGISSIAVGLSPSWEWALFFRALGGLGAGLFFSTAGAVLIVLKPDAVGSILGWYNASFNLGGFLGYYWGYVASLVGWRIAIAIPGVISAAFGAMLLKSASLKSETSISWKTSVFGLASFPFWGAVYAANSLTATWLHLFRGMEESYAGAISSASMLSGFFGGVFGRLYDRTKNKRRLLLYTPIFASIAYLAMPDTPIEAAPLLAFIYGASFSAYITAVYATASKVSRNPASALAVINVINMALGLHFSYAFSLLMAFSPTYPWLLLSALAFLSAIATYIVINMLKIY